MRSFFASSRKEDPKGAYKDCTICDIEDGVLIAPKAKLDHVDHVAVVKEVDDVSYGSAYDKAEGKIPLPSAVYP